MALDARKRVREFGMGDTGVALLQPWGIFSYASSFSHV